MDWLKCYWVKLNRYKKILSKSFFGVWLSLARALALGARGPEFKSLYPDLIVYWGIAKLVKAQDLEGSFNGRMPEYKKSGDNSSNLFPSTMTPAFVGSNPTTPAMEKDAISRRAT